MIDPHCDPLTIEHLDQAKGLVRTNDGYAGVIITNELGYEFVRKAHYDVRTIPETVEISVPDLEGGTRMQRVILGWNHPLHGIILDCIGEIGVERIPSLTAFPAPGAMIPAALPTIELPGVGLPTIQLPEIAAPTIEVPRPRLPRPPIRPEEVVRAVAPDIDMAPMELDFGAGRLCVQAPVTFWMRHGM